MLAISSAPLGGGLGLRQWVLNVQVPHAYDGTEPGSHLAALAAEAGVLGLGVGMMTAVDVRVASTAHHDGIVVDATVGVSGARCGPPPRPFGSGRCLRSWHHQHRGGPPGAIERRGPRQCDRHRHRSQGPGLVGCRDRRHGNRHRRAVRALPAPWDVHAYGGPRSLWGGRLARVVYRAVRAGCQAVQPA